VFNSPDLLRQALTHSSYTHEKLQAESNERLEFLGDAVLELAISDLLYTRFPKLTEGELTKRRAALVCEPSLAALARQLDVGDHLMLGHGEKMTGGQNRDSLLSDAMEAIIGAVYMDSAFDTAKAFIQRLFAPLVEKSEKFVDPKTDLQEIIQRTSREPLVYAIVDEDGPPHHKVFTATVSHEGRELGRGTGRSKKEAEQSAAGMALKSY
jgi:ribonuclease-3